MHTFFVGVASLSGTRHRGLARAEVESRNCSNVKSFTSTWKHAQSFERRSFFGNVCYFNRHVRFTFKQSESHGYEICAAITQMKPPPQPEKLAGKDMEDFLESYDKSGSNILILCNREIDAQAAEILTSYLRRNKEQKGRIGCKHLSVTINEIGDKAAADIADLVREDPETTLLILSNNGLTAACAPRMMELVQKNMVLDAVDLAYNALGNKASADIFKAMAHAGSPLRVLCLGGNQLTDEAVHAMADAVRTVPPERFVYRAGADFRMSAGFELFLTHNNITGDGVEDFFDGLLSTDFGRNTTLVALSHNPIGDKGARAIANFQKQRNRLYRLDLDNTGITDDGVVELADALKHTSTVTRCYLCDNDIGDRGAIALADALKVNNTLSRLDLKNNHISDEGAFALAEAVVANNKGLTWIQLNRNNISQAGAQALVEANKKNPQCSVIGVKKIAEGSL